MSNTWRDDTFYGEPWVRVAGPVAVLLYTAAEDYCHRELSGSTVPFAILGSLLPWPMRPGEIDGAIEILERLGRFERTLDSVILPRYYLEQEGDEQQKSARARQVFAGRARAAQAKRDAHGKMTKSQPESSQWLAGTSQNPAAGWSPPASVRPSVRPSVHMQETEAPSEPLPSPSAPASRRRKPRAEPTDDYSRVIALWDALWKGLTGGAPTINGVGGKAVKALLARHSRAVIEERMHRFFAEKEPRFIWKSGAPPLHVFAAPGCFDRLAQVGAPIASNSMAEFFPFPKG